MQLTSAPRRRQKYIRFRFGLAAIAILVTPCVAPPGAWGRRGARPAIQMEADTDGDPRDDDASAAKANAESASEATPGEEEDEEAVRRPRRRRKPKPRAIGGGPSVRASTEVSAYTDSDAVHVLSPTVAGSVGDDLAGWSIGGSYLVDAVSAASVDI